MNWKTHITCNFNGCIETTGLLKVTDSHVHCKSGIISETVQDDNAVTTDHWQEVIYGLLYKSSLWLENINKLTPSSALNCIISDDLEWLSRSCTYYRAFKMQFFMEFCSSWQHFNRYSMTAKLLSLITIFHIYMLITSSVNGVLVSLL